MKTNCGACGAALIDGKHPSVRCEARDWAINHGNLLSEILAALTAVLAAFESHSPEKPAAEPATEWPRKKKK